jgi:hypothetical protein
MDKADSIRVREQVYRLKNVALERKESEMAARSELELTLLETIALIWSQSTIANVYIQEIRETETLSDMKNRMKMKGMEEKMEGIKKGQQGG